MDTESIGMINWEVVPGSNPHVEIGLYDWEEAFRYADGFKQSEVETVLYAHAESDEGYGQIEIHALFELGDGKFACLSAGCDTSGWDCQAGGEGTVHDSLDHAVTFGLTDDVRRMFGIEQPNDVNVKDALADLWAIDQELSEIDVAEE